MAYRGKQRRWTPERIANFLKDWKTLPHSEVARKYGLTLRSAESAYYQHRKLEAPAAPLPKPLTLIEVDSGVATKLLAQAKDWIATAASRNKPRPVPAYYTQLMTSGCRYAYGDRPSDPDFHFCGARSEPGTPWCPMHRARVWIGKPERRTAR